MAFREEVAKDSLTYDIIGCAIEVHKELGPHQPEHIYRDGLCVVLADEGFEVEQEHEVDITIRGKKIGSGFVDILVEGEVALELKAVNKRTTEDHFNQLGRNVRAASATRGLLLNFGETTLSTRRWINAGVKEVADAPNLKDSEAAKV